MDTIATTAPELETFQPHELADLLGISRGDIGLITTAPIKLPAGWAAAWKGRAGALELSVGEAARILSRHYKTVSEWCRPMHGQPARLACRRSGPRFLRISPAALVACLKRMAGGSSPVILETPAQKERRGASAKARALAACGQSRGKRAG